MKAPHKSLVLGCVEVITYIDKKNGKEKQKAGRLRLTKVKHANETTIREFLEKNVESGSTVRTDGWRGYSEIALRGYTHKQQVQHTPDQAHFLAPHIHRTFSNLKTWLNGTHHGVDPKYLQAYLDEYIFRFNRRATPMAAFQTLLGISTKKSPLPLADLR